MSNESLIEFAHGDVALNPSPIYTSWILDGNPIARNKVLSSSPDGTATTLIWDCTAGRFNWFYDVDETVYVIEGSVTVKGPSGVSRYVSTGETVFFPAGSQAEWTVDRYIRKIAFCRKPLPQPLVVAKRGLRFLRQMLGSGAGRSSAPAMFQNG